MRRFANHIIYLAALAVVAMALYYFAWLRTMLNLVNVPLVESLIGEMNWLGSGTLRPVIHGGLYVLEAILLAWLLTQVVKIPLGALVPRITVNHGVRLLIMMVGVLSSAYMATYAYTILYGAVSLNGTVIMNANNPSTISFSAGIALGATVLWYVVAQLLPYAARSTVSIPWTVADTLTSFAYVGVIVTAAVSYKFGTTYMISPFRLGALYVFIPSAFIEVLSLVISYRFMARGWLSEGGGDEVIVAGGHRR